MRKIDELKLKNKETSKQLRERNLKLKENQKQGKCCSNEMCSLYYARKEYRHYHIAYCELRGRTRDQIEKPRRGNEVNEQLIQNIKNEYAWEILDTGANNE